MRIAIASLLFSTLVFAKGEAAGTKVDVKGHYYETCACKVSCPCATGMFTPTESHCDAVSFFHLDKAMVGKTKLDGLNIALVFKTPANQIVLDAFKKGEMDHFALYLDNKATDEQKKALPVLMEALFGKDTPKGAKPPAFVPITLTSDGETAKFSAGDKLSAEIINIKIGETKDGGKITPKHITLDGAVPFPWMGKVTQGKSASFHYADGATKWDYKDRNAYFGEFAHKATVAEAPAAK